MENKHRETRLEEFAESERNSFFFPLKRVHGLFNDCRERNITADG